MKPFTGAPGARVSTSTTLFNVPEWSSGWTKVGRMTPRISSGL